MDPVNPPKRSWVADRLDEAAVAGRCSAIVSFNRRDFAGAERFNLAISTPQGFLKNIGALP
jgi:hypothetical protein